MLVKKINMLNHNWIKYLTSKNIEPNVFSVANSRDWKTKIGIIINA